MVEFTDRRRVFSLSSSFFLFKNTCKLLIEVLIIDFIYISLISVVVIWFWMPGNS